MNDSQPTPHAYIDRFKDINSLNQNEVNKHLRYGINVCGQNLFFDPSMLCETAMDVDIYPIPNLPPWLLGVINLRGNLIPVFRIDHFLLDNALLENAKSTQQKNTIIFMVSKGNNDTVGFLVPKLPIAIDMNEDAITMIENHNSEDVPTFFSDCSNKAYKINDEMWLEIDLDLILDSLSTSTN